MADDRGSKRPKIAVGASGGDARDDARNDALESEIHALRQQLVRSEAEVARVRRENERYASASSSRETTKCSQ